MLEYRWRGRDFLMLKKKKKNSERNSSAAKYSSKHTTDYADCSQDFIDETFHTCQDRNLNILNVLEQMSSNPRMLELLVM